MDAKNENMMELDFVKKRLFSTIINNKWRSWFVYIAFIVLVIIFSLLSARFRTLENLSVIGRQVAIVAILAYGMTFVITTAEIDLSVGSIVALAGMVSSICLISGWGVLPASLAGILTGTFFGFLNGIIVAKLRIPSFLVTLGMLGIARGIALTLTGTMPVTLYNQDFGRLWGSKEILGIPVMILWMLLFYAVSIIAYNFTPFGNYVKAVGGNRTAAKYSGINIDKILVSVFTISGFLAGIGGLLMVARLNCGRPEVGVDLNTDAITAVILGGTSLFGGKGSVVNALVGALIITVITDALIILGIDVNIQMVIKGLIVIAAVSLSEKS